MSAWATSTSRSPPPAARAWTGRLTLTALMARGEHAQKAKSIYVLSTLGEIAALDDPRVADDEASASR